METGAQFTTNAEKHPHSHQHPHTHTHTALLLVPHTARLKTKKIILKVSLHIKVAHWIHINQFVKNLKGKITWHANNLHDYSSFTSTCFQSKAFFNFWPWLVLAVCIWIGTKFETVVMNFEEPYSIIYHSLSFICMWHMWIPLVWPFAITMGRTLDRFM